MREDVGEVEAPGCAILRANDVTFTLRLRDINPAIHDRPGSPDERITRWRQFIRRDIVIKTRECSVAHDEPDVTLFVNHAAYLKDARKRSR